jgi:hypothetical protein
MRMIQSDNIDLNYLNRKYDVQHSELINSKGMLKDLPRATIQVFCAGDIG